MLLATFQINLTPFMQRKKYKESQRNSIFLDYHAVVGEGGEGVHQSVLLEYI